MGYLVYCPTCGGKMSNQAERCPHCGETAFFIRRDRETYVEEPCSGGCGGKWSRCDGRGWYYRLHLLISRGSDMSEGANLVRLKDGSRYFFEERFLSDPKVIEALRTGDYVVELTGGGANPFWSFHYERIACPACRGRGTVRVPQAEYDWEDVRNPVE